MNFPGAPGTHRYSPHGALRVGTGPLFSQADQHISSNHRDSDMALAPICPGEAGVGLLAAGPSMQLRALGIEAVVDTSSKFRLGDHHYLARPSGFKRYYPDCNEVGKNDEGSLATCFRVQKNQTIDAECLRAWRAILDHDDVFHPSFLQEVIFSGTDDVHLESDTKDVFEAWETLHISFVTDLSISNGPYYVMNGAIYSIWRLYEDHQLAFVQATWPSIEDERYFSLL